jgi:DNA-directed RNA polymerase sigma subunit (sigma70/sigma32)
MKQIIKLLSEQEVYVLSERLKGKTLKEVGLSMKPVREDKNKNCDGHLDKERVRQIENKAIRKLRSFFYKEFYRKIKNNPS